MDYNRVFEYVGHMGQAMNEQLAVCTGELDSAFLLYIAKSRAWKVDKNIWFLYGGTDHTHRNSISIGNGWGWKEKIWVACQERNLAELHQEISLVRAGKSAYSKMTSLQILVASNTNSSLPRLHRSAACMIRISNIHRTLFPSLDQSIFILTL